MNHRIFFLICWCLLLPSLGIAAQTTVNFQAKATVTGPRIVLADIAAIRPAGPEADLIGRLPVAAAPAPGKTKALAAATVASSLRNRPEVAEVDWQGSQTIEVERGAQTLAPEQLQEMIAGYLRDNRAKLPQAEVRFAAIRAPEPVTLPVGQLSWRVTPSRPGIMGSTSFTIVLLVDGKAAGTCIVRGRIEAAAEVAVAATTLHKGDVLTVANLALERRDISAIDSPFLNPDELIGKQMARTVPAGAVLKQDHVDLPPLVKDGEMVKIFARKGLMQLSASGLARTDGRLGETISVKNIASNKVIHGRVEGPGMVTVEF